MRGNPDLIMAVDLWKAFDNVSQQAILEELAHAYLSARTQNWIMSFLISWPVRLEESHPGWEPKTYYLNPGVPQGSISDPLLFNLAITRVARQLEADSAARFPIYADDMRVWTEAADFERLEGQIVELQAAAKSIEIYHFNWHLKELFAWQYMVVNRHTHPKEFK